MNKKTLEGLEEALERLEHIDGVYSWGHLLFEVREALAKPQITTPDVCGEVCARSKLCYGCGKSFDEALADHSGDANEMVAEPVWILPGGGLVGKAEPVKQEPVAWATKISKAFFNSPANGVFQVSHLMRDEYNVPLYASPVDAKAIRAEALEEAAKLCEEGTALTAFQSKDCYSYARNRAVAIRGLK